MSLSSIAKVFLGLTLGWAGITGEGFGQDTDTGAAPNRKVHVLIMGLTDDPSIGSGINTNVLEIKRIIDTGIPAARLGSVNIIKGKDTTAKNMQAAVDRLAIDPQDALFCYYSGHGAYDPARAAMDPSGGHFFQIPSGDLMRKDLWDRLQTKKARLTVLITDTCNVKAVAHPIFPKKYYQIVGENPVLMSLLLGHQGMIDISGSARDQFGWFTSPHPGGWFTHALVDVAVTHHFPVPSRVSWGQFMQEVSNATSAIYNTRRKDILASPGKTRQEVLNQLRGQSDQRPQIFQMKFVGDTMSPVPPPPSGPILFVGSTGLRIPGQLTGTEPRDRVRKASFHRVYLVRLEAGHTYHVELQSARMDMFFRIESATGRELAWDDDSGGARNALIHFRPSVTGIYRIIATTYGPATGPYTLMVRDESPSRGTVVGPNGLVLRGNLVHTDPMDRMRKDSHAKAFEVFLIGGRTYIMTLESAAFDTFLRVENQAGAQFTFDDDSGLGLNSRIDFHPWASGPFRIIATSYRHATGPFQLTIRER